MKDPYYSVRFFIRATKRQRGDTPAPLRIRVWIRAQKSLIYLSTSDKVTPDQWKYFQPDGTPLKGADPKIANIVNQWRAAANVVLTEAVLNNRIDTITSEIFKFKVEAVKNRIEINEKSGQDRPIIVFESPEKIETCAGCIFRDETCRAPWSSNREREHAPELAAFNAMCRMRVSEEGKYHPTPSREPQEGINEKLAIAAIRVLLADILNSDEVKHIMKQVEEGRIK